MRYEKGQKERTRQRVIDVASRAFRRDGVVASGIAGVMAEAGLTQGGFYAHFSSKDDLIREAAVAALDRSRTVLARKADAAVAEGRSGLVAIVDEYLRDICVEHPERGCAIAALGPELARQPSDTKQAVGAAIERTVALIAAHISVEAAEAHSTAYAIFGLAAGTLQLAQNAPDKAKAASVIAAGRKAALALANVVETGPDRNSSPGIRHG
jgi:TetR/AcrR family transcriptional repressor of nem operon